MKKKDEAIQLFSKKFNCTQAVFSVFATDYGLPKEAALRIASPFGAGMCRMQETCGAVTGALMVLGLVHGMEREGDLAAKEKSYEMGKIFIKEFIGKNKSVQCLELIGADMNTDEGKLKIEQGDLYKNLCAKYVVCSVEILEKMLVP